MRRFTWPPPDAEANPMLGLLIADKDVEARRQMADLFIEEGYNVTVTSSAANALHGILKRTAQVVLVGGDFDDLTVILVSGEKSPAFIRKLRREGIFYHALKPLDDEDREEIRQAVHCAFDRLNSKRHRH